jgi:hypothetical protein
MRKDVDDVRNVRILETDITKRQPVAIANGTHASGKIQKKRLANDHPDRVE